MREFSLSELKEYNGEHGKPVYVAYKGKVYDLTNSPLWETGLHEDEHGAGSDLTTHMVDAPHDESYLEDFEQVGIVVDK